MTLSKLEKVFSSNLFLALAILSILVAVFGGGIIAILVCIGLFITYAAAKKKTLSQNQTGLKMVSGSIKAVWIINWVGIGFITLTAISVIAFGSFFVNIGANYVKNNADELTEHIDEIINSEDFRDELEKYGIDDSISDSLKAQGEKISADEIYDYIEDNIDENGIVDFVDIFAGISNIIIAVIFVFMLILAGIYAVINVFCYRNMHKLAKSVCVSYETGNAALAKTGVVKGWCIALAVISGIGFLSGLPTIYLLFASYATIGRGCSCAMYIIAFILISRLENEAKITDEPAMEIPQHAEQL